MRPRSKIVHCSDKNSVILLITTWLHLLVFMFYLWALASLNEVLSPFFPVGLCGMCDWVCVSDCVNVTVCVSVCKCVWVCDQVTTRRWYTSNTFIWSINKLHLLLLLVFGKKDTVGRNLYCTIRSGGRCKVLKAARLWQPVKRTVIPYPIVQYRFNPTKHTRRAVYL